MTRIIGDFPIVEWAVIAWLKTQCPSNFIIVGTLPVDFATPSGPPTIDAPLILVEQIPGGGGAEFELEQDVDVTVFAKSKTLAWQASQPITKAMNLLPGRGDVMIDYVETRSHFGFSGYADNNVRRVVASYRLTTRPQ